MAAVVGESGVRPGVGCVDDVRVRYGEQVAVFGEVVVSVLEKVFEDWPDEVAAVFADHRAAGDGLAGDEAPADDARLR